MIDFVLVCLYKEVVVSPVASKYCDDFVECLNEIYAHLSVQYHVLYPGVWADQGNCQGGYLVIPQRAG